MYWHLALEGIQVFVVVQIKLPHVCNILVKIFAVSTESIDRFTRSMGKLQEMKMVENGQHSKKLTKEGKERIERRCNCMFYSPI